RRGLNVAVGKRLYVSQVDPENNVVYVDEENSLYKSEFMTKDINLMMTEKIDSPVKVNVKIRYNDIGHEAVIEQTGNDNIKVVFDSPQKAITPGQSAVFYIGDDLLGGGIIEKILDF
ncbi:MAG: aminomethyltransferase beta-barrel domain-containing protein, partial [bacterium]